VADQGCPQNIAIMDNNEVKHLGNTYTELKSIKFQIYRAAKTVITDREFKLFKN
jgi:hypothetical protein